MFGPVAAALSLLGASVTATDVQLWEDEIDDPDVDLSLAQKTKKAVVRAAIECHSTKLSAGV